jgi:hypothetical protein
MALKIAAVADADPTVAMIVRSGRGTASESDNPNVLATSWA